MGQRLPEEQAKNMQEWVDYTQFLKDKGYHIAGDALHPTSDATTVRVRDGKTITTDGPFAETKEQLGGYYLVTARISTRRSRRARACRWAPRDRRDPTDLLYDEEGHPSCSDRDRRRRRPPVPSRAGAGGRDDDPGPGRLRPRRGRGAGRVRAGDAGVARTRDPRQPRRVDHDDARNRAIDRLRRERTLREKTAQLGVVEALESLGGDETDVSGIPDDRLRLIFTCCHPALRMDARVALTLKTLGGLTGEIARAFLVPEPTMAQRLVRAKHKIREAAIPYRVRPPSSCPNACLACSPSCTWSSTRGARPPAARSTDL